MRKTGLPPKPLHRDRDYARPVLCDAFELAMTLECATDMSVEWIIDRAETPSEHLK